MTRSPRHPLLVALLSLALAVVVAWWWLGKLGVLVVVGSVALGLLIYFTTPKSAYSDPRLFLTSRRCPRCGYLLLLAVLVSVACHGSSPTELRHADYVVNTEHFSYAVQTNGRDFDKNVATAAIEQSFAENCALVPKLCTLQPAFNVIVEPDPFRDSTSPTGWVHGMTVYPIGPIHNGEHQERNLYWESRFIWCGYLAGSSGCCYSMDRGVPLSECAK